MIPAMPNPEETLRFAVERYPEKLQVLPLDRLVMESARQNDRRPAWVKVALPDPLVRSLRGGAEADEVVLLVVVPREVAARRESRIVLPGEVR
jgi:hypothetical protein